MNFIKKLYSLLLFCLLFQLSAFAQDDSVSLNTIIEKAVKYSEHYPPENAHIHFDKPYYAVGDTIWFKAYVASRLRQPSPLSKIIYVDVINERDSLIETIKLPVSNGIASGNLTLAPLNYSQGNYQFRAYTNWMLNFGESYFFSKTVTVGNTLNKRLYTNIELNGSQSDKSAQISAKVQFKDEQGKPYANRKVSWKVDSKFETISKGRGTTDDNGYLTVSVSNNNKAVLDAGRLETILTLDDRNLTSNFPLKSALTTNDIQFLPEGGIAIAGLTTKFAFKAIKSDGLGVGAKGEITDNTGKKVADFASQHLGLGAVTFIPELNKTYVANVAFADGTRGTFKMPESLTEGISIAVSSADTANLSVRIAASSTFLENYRNKAFYIVAQSAGVICYAAQTKLQSQIYNALIPKDKFPTGIVQITLFTSSGMPLSERIAFVQHQNPFIIKLTSDKPSYQPRQKVKMNISAKSPLNVLPGSYSLAVVDEIKVPFNEDAETSILSSLLLKSDLKGYIELPNYYFNRQDDKKREDLDLLMLTQGYRAFEYENYMNDKYPPIAFMPEQGMDITGTLRQMNGMPVNKGNMQLSIPDKNISLSVLTDADGKFRFSKLDFPDSSKAILSARNNINSRNMMIVVDGAAFPAITQNQNVADEIVNIDSILSPYLENSKRQYRTANLLDEVVVKAKSPVKRPSHADHSSLSGLSMMPDHLIEGERFKDCPFLINCLKTSAMGLIFADEQFYVNRDYNAGRRVPVQIFLNGMPIDVTGLNSVASSEVESVEIFLKDDLGTVNRLYNTNGVLVVNTKKVEKLKLKPGDLADILPKSNVVDFTPLGYRKARQFYSPKYEGPRKGVISADLRTTIFWDPLITTDKDGNASVEFYNSDGKGSFRAIIEGMDNEGNIGRYLYRYTVK